MKALWPSLVLLVCCSVPALGAGAAPVAIAVLAGGLAVVALRGSWPRLGAALGVAGLAGALVAAGLATQKAGPAALILALPAAVALVALLAAVGAERDGEHGGDGEASAAGGAWSTLAFYAVAVAAYVLLSGVPSGLASPLRAAIAALAFACAMLGWRTAPPPRRFRRLRGLPAAGWGVLGAMFAAVLAMLLQPLPWAGTEVVEASAHAREWGRSMLDRWQGDGRGGATDDAGGGTGLGGAVAGEGSEEEGRRLPDRAELQLSEVEFAHIQLRDAGEFATFIARPRYLRRQALERYEEGAWLPGAGGRGVVEDTDDGLVDGWVQLGRAGQGARGAPLTHRVYLPSAPGFGVMAIQGMSAVRLPFVLESAPDTFEAELRGAVYYDARSSPLVFAELERRGERIVAAAGVRPDPSGAAGRAAGGRLADTVAEIIAEASSDAERLRAIRGFLHRQCRYSLRVENPQELEPLTNFLYGERVGWCEHFASAAALMALEAGIPARVAYGFSGGTAYPGPRVVTYREFDGHAWTEVLLEGFGWVVFEATPPDQGALHPPRPGDGGGADRFGPDLSGYADAASLPGGDAGSQPEPVSRRGWGDVAGWALRLGAAALVGMALVALWRWAMRGAEPEPESEPEARAARDAERSAPAYLREFLRLCRERGRPKPMGETLREAASALARAGLDERALWRLADYHYAVSYAGGARDRGEERSLRDAMKRLRKGE